MAAVAQRRMSGAVQAKLPPKLGIQVPGGLARPLVLVLLLVSATMSSGKGGVGAGRQRGPGRGPGDRQGWGKGASEYLEQKAMARWGRVSTGPRRESRLSEEV